MKQFIDYIPLVVFFVVWTMDERMVTVAGIQHSVGGIYSAAEFLIVISILVYGSLFVVQKRLDKFQWITLLAVVLFCIPTILFRDINFLKWKAPIVYWIFALIFIGSRFIGDKSAIEHMMGHLVTPPTEVWSKLNNAWIIYFLVLGAVNLLVAYTLSEEAWIRFKVFGNMICSFVFILAQMPVLARYMELDEDEDEATVSDKDRQPGSAREESA